MDIGALRVRIVIQKSSTAVDKYGNHLSSWTDYFTCWATANTSGRQSDETEKAAVTQEKNAVDFTVRYSPEVAQVNTKEYRILLDNRIYNIRSIDEMGFKKNSRKFHAELEVNYTEQSANYSMVREARG